MNIELTDDEAITIMVALDSYAAQKRVEWMSSRADPDAPNMGDEELLDEAGSAEWVWQKIHGQRDVDRIEAEIRAGTAPVDPFSLPPSRGA
jgi:hypothetical protein